MSTRNILIVVVILILAFGWIFRRSLLYSYYFVYAIFQSQTWDAGTDAEIALLHPAIRNKARKFINQAEKELGIRLQIISGLRTILEQNNLYKQGRTTAGEIVTNARGGESYHNYGLAFDVQPVGYVSSQLWEQIGVLGESLGFRWGGRFISLVDKPHFEYDQDAHHTELLVRVGRGQVTNGYVNLETA